MNVQLAHRGNQNCAFFTNGLFNEPIIIHVEGLPINGNLWDRIKVAAKIVWNPRLITNVQIQINGCDFRPRDAQSKTVDVNFSNNPS